MKQIIWLGKTHERVKSYSNSVKQEIGYNLEKIQRGLEPSDWKPMLSVGHGVKEIRIHQENEYRVLYVAKFAGSIYVLHAFVKKSQQTQKRDIDLTKQRYLEMINMRRTQK
jgi:phage-related protein